MDKRIAVLITSEIIINKVKTICKQQSLEYPLMLAHFEQLAQYGKEAIDNGAKVFISRGRSAVFLKQFFTLPVVMLRFTYYDFVVAIQEAQNYSNRIVIVGYKDSWFAPLERYRDILSNPRTLYLHTHKELNETMQSLAEEGVEVIIGGKTATDVARRYGLKTVNIGIEDSSILDSIEEAQHLLRIELQHTEHMATVNAILNSTSEGVIAVNNNGIVTSINASARDIIKKDCTGESFAEISGNDLIRSAISTKKPLRNELLEFEGTLCSVSSSTINLDNKSGGVVFNIQPVNVVQSLDQNIRSKQSQSGNIAKIQFEDITGSSKVMNTTIKKAKKFSQSDSTVLILGETGTGKEMFAQSIHNYSKRAGGPFVAINCAALPQSILESELFGYAKGAFTGANTSGKMGYFEMAHTGTIFLDEIGEIPLDMQTKLLRVLQEKELRRVGDRKVFKVDIRVIAASNQNLKSMVERGEFREDLYYRLAVLELYIPSIRQRKEDVIQIVELILSEIIEEQSLQPIRLSNEVKSLLPNIDWCGNVRQIRNIVERMVAMCDNGVLDKSLLEEALNVGGKMPYRKMPKTNNFRPISEAEKLAVAKALKIEKGNRKQAAIRLGISKTTLWRRIKYINTEFPGFLEEVYYKDILNASK